MKRLFLLRHAKATRDGRTRSDHERPLSPRGICAAESMAECCAKSLRRVDFVLCSTSVRTQETLRIFESHLSPSCKITLAEGLYLAEGEVLRVALRGVEDRFDAVLMVGHEPGLSELATDLCREAGSSKAMRRFAKGFKTSSLVTIDLKIDEWRETRPGIGRMRRMIRPKDIG